MYLRSLAPVVSHLACSGGPMVADAISGAKIPVWTAIPNWYRSFWSRERLAKISSLTGLILPGTGVNATVGTIQTSLTMRCPIGPDQASGPLVGRQAPPDGKVRLDVPRLLVNFLPVYASKRAHSDGACTPISGTQFLAPTE